MNQEDKQFIENNFKYIETAGTRDYVMGVPVKIATEFFNIAKRNNIKTGSISCHKCVYDACKALYKIYSSETPKSENNINYNQEEESSLEVISSDLENKETTEQPKTTKRSRKNKKN